MDAGLCTTQVKAMALLQLCLEWLAAQHPSKGRYMEALHCLLLHACT